MAGKGAKYKDPSRVSKSSNDKEETKENYASLQQPLPGNFYNMLITILWTEPNFSRLKFWNS